MQRITNSILVSNYLNSTQRNLSTLGTYQNQLASGKTIQRATQNPYVATKLMQLNAEITANKQYNTNISDTSNWLDSTDTAFSQMGNVYSRIRELMVKAGNGTYSPDEISTIKQEVVEKVQQLGQVLNSSFDGSYIFGGTKTTSKPITVDNNGSISYADKEGHALPCTSTGSSIVIGAGPSALTVTGITKDGTDMKISYNNTSVPPVTSTVSVSTINGSNIPYNDSNLESQIQTAVQTAVGAPPTGPAVTATNAKDMLSSYNSINQIGSDLKTEVSEGVVVNYNKTATDVLEFTDNSTNPGTKINVSDVLNSIIGNLTTASTAANPAAQRVTAISDLTGTNLTQLDKITQNLLQCRSSVGALQNRMESAQQNNEADNENMTEILAQVGDVDYAEATMNYAVAQTSYTASLQVSAKVLSKTLLDYL